MNKLHHENQRGYLLLSISIFILILSSLFLLQSQKFILTNRSYAGYQFVNQVDQVLALQKDLVEKYIKIEAVFANLLDLEKEKTISLCLEKNMEYVASEQCDWIEMEDISQVKLSVGILKADFAFIQFEQKDYYRMDFNVRLKSTVEHKKFNDVENSKLWFLTTLMMTDDFKTYQKKEITLDQLLENTHFIWLQAL